MGRHHLSQNNDVLSWVEVEKYSPESPEQPSQVLSSIFSPSFSSESCTPEDDEEDADVEKADEDFEDGRSRLVALTLSLLMAAILQAIRSVGSIVHDVVHTLHWDFDSHWTMIYFKL